MNVNLSDFKKEIAVLVLLLMWIALDVFHVNDDPLKYTIMGLVASMTGFAGVKPFSAESIS